MIEIKGKVIFISAAAWITGISQGLLHVRHLRSFNIIKYHLKSINQAPFFHTYRHFTSSCRSCDNMIWELAFIHKEVINCKRDKSHGRPSAFLGV